ncbi:dihydropyrimidinase [Oscillospiraceae bacterium OttesenSCG-928-G22]|nr:dihydropyrimidinase [Oscillospiraceae bacterium OttesenSCG-928-G22]
MSTLIKNGTIVTSEGEYKADVLIDGEKIVEIGMNLDGKADETIDASGKYILPGGIDNHTHFGMPFMGTYTAGCENSHSALVGGTTTVIDFVPQEVGTGLIDAAKKHKAEKFDGICSPDYALHAMVMDVTEEMYNDIKKLPEIGISTIKLFMAYKTSVYYCDDSIVYRAMKSAKEVGVTLMVHAESADIIEMLQKDCADAGQLDPKYHAVSRPPIVETECIQRAIVLSDLTETPIFIVHVSAKEAMATLRDAAAHGTEIYGETCPQYICLDVANLSKPGFEGAKYICSPAIRTPDHHEAILEAIQKGWLQVFASDNAAFNFKGQKEMGLGDFRKVPNGAPGVQHRMHALWTHGVATGKVSKSRFVDVCSTAPAKFNGIYPQKGAILVGADADILIWDPDYKGTISIKDTFEGVDYTPYEGQDQIGRADKVFLRGKLMAEKGQMVGPKGEGKYIEQKPYGAAYQGGV